MDRVWEEARPMAAVRELRDRLMLNDSAPVMPDLDAVLAARGLEGISRSSSQFRVFAREAMRIYIQAREIDAEREDAGYVEDSGDNRRTSLALLLAAFVPPARQRRPASMPRSLPCLSQRAPGVGPMPMLGDEFERLAPPRPRLRAAPRRLRSHDPYRPRIPPAQANCQLNRILKRTLRGLLLEVSYTICPISSQDCLL
jgi:hypothetical protein